MAVPNSPELSDELVVAVPSRQTFVSDEHFDADLKLHQVPTARGHPLDTSQQMKQSSDSW